MKSKLTVAFMLLFTSSGVAVNVPLDELNTEYDQLIIHSGNQNVHFRIIKTQ